MKHKEMRIIPAKEVEDISKITCDICGKEIKTHNFDIDKVEIKRDVGYHCPDGGSFDSTEYDVCGNCFEKEIIPWFTSKGINPQYSEHDI